MENSSILLLNSSFAFLILSKRKEDEKEGRRLAEMCVYLLIFFMSLLINASVFYVVLYGKKTSRRSVSLLIAHLSVVTITWSLHGVLYTADKYEIIILRAPYLCEIWSFARNTHHAVFPLNIFGIVYERLRSFREECDGYYLIVHRAIILIWVISAVFSWPSFFAYKFEADATGEGFGTCKKFISRKRRKHALVEVEDQNGSQHQAEGESKKEEKGNCENVELALINCERRTGFGPTVAQAELELLNKQEEKVVAENHATLQDVECTETFV
ncbi:unnamed protein product [Orchesella dallaii]|uniref:G-protein coupled receptors family 1 profile domain-containing protein n=1 Tax=Orchesella dallaii TaxID=48710 RepID=A0ABP1RK11_9HEXA